MLTLILSAVILIFIVLLDFLKNKEFYKYASRFPGPRCLPLIGNAYLFSTTNLTNVLKTYMRILHIYPSPSRLWMGNSFWINVYDADQVQNILTKVMEKGTFYKFSESWLGNGLTISSESIWHYHRKFLRSAFSIKVLRPFLQIFQKHSKILVENLSTEVLEGKEFQILTYVLDACLDITLETTAGVSKYSKIDYTKFFNEVNRVLDLMLKRGLSFWLHLDIIYKFTKDFEIFNESVYVLRNTTHNIINQKRMELMKMDMNEKDKMENDGKNHFCNLS